MTLSLFYQEPNFDRWVPYDRYPRAVIRRLLRGPAPIGGQKRVFLNLCSGLRELGISFRVNDFKYARKNPHSPVGVVGKPHVLELQHWENPILFGSAVMSHPLAAPNLLEKYPIRRTLVPGEWMRQMCEPYWGKTVKAWPVGIDTRHWQPRLETGKTVEVLIYNKFLWNRERNETDLAEPIRDHLRRAGRTFEEIRYGSYRSDDYRNALSRCRAMIFLCEHETQGIGYQEALAMEVPIFAWDSQGEWLDPEFYPHRVRYSPVTSVPYWDERCGHIFKNIDEFRDGFAPFWENVLAGSFAPRDYILENLTLKKAAAAYLRHWDEAFDQSGRPIRPDDSQDRKFIRIFSAGVGLPLGLPCWLEEVSSVGVCA